MPDRVAMRRDGRVPSLGGRSPTDELASNPRHWELAPGAAWHGFSKVAPGYAITDPNKLILLTPGFDRASGGYAECGIPAPVVAQYLRENQVVPEKNDLNSMLFLLTPGVESSKAGTLLSSLVAFKRLYDDNARLDDAIGEFVRRRPARYSGVRLRDLCGEMHASSARAASAPCSARSSRPSTCRRRRWRRTRRSASWCATTSTMCRSKKAYGRIATTLFVVYPPGIASIVPGERLDERAKPMLDYLKMFETSANLFPGFEVEIQGIYREVESDGRVRFHTYVARE